MDIAGSFMSTDVNVRPARQPRSLLECLFELLSDAYQGGFAALISDFQANGLSDVMTSWTGVDQNLPVTALEIRQGMGEARIQWLADAANMSPVRVCGSLVELLPVLVNTLTPGGKLPDKNSLTHCLRFMRSRLLGC